VPAGEVNVTCAGCGLSTRMPFAAVRRDNCYCSRCGARIPLGDISLMQQEDDGGRSRPRRRPFNARRRR
jgi:CxxC-x17-CxxC domain-containing protein